MAVMLMYINSNAKFGKCRIFSYASALKNRHGKIDTAQLTNRRYGYTKLSKVLNMQHVQIAKWGNSLGFRIPRGIAESMQIKAGDALELTPADGGLLLKKVENRGKRYILADILDSFPKATDYPEADFGPPNGEEAW
jgi:antitoxin MazE